MTNEIKCPKCREIFQVDENHYAAIVKQVKDKEFSKELKNREIQFENDKNNLIKLTKLELEKEFNKELSDKNAKINELESEIKAKEETFVAKLGEFIAVKDKEVLELQNKLKNFNKDKDLQIANIMTDMSNKLTAQENFILKMTNESELAEKEFKLREQALKDQYENKLRFKDEEIERYKDFKAKLSTKMVGETLEQHCDYVQQVFKMLTLKKITMQKAEVKVIISTVTWILKVENLSQ